MSASDGALGKLERPASVLRGGAPRKEIDVRRYVALFLAMALNGETALAQRKPSVPMTAVSSRGRLSGKTKVTYLLRQLDLDAAQRQRARALMEATLDTGSDDLSLDRVYQLMAEIQQAEADGNAEQKEALESELRQLGKGSNRGEEEFFMNFEPELSEPQKVKLKEARQRLERIPSGALRPIDIFRLLPGLQPTAEQQKEFDEIKTDLRESLRKTKNLGEKERFQLMNGLLATIKKRLTPEQETRFELGVRQLRPDMAFRLRVRLSDAPNGEGEDEDD